MPKRAPLGSVALVGAGPGDPGLITVRGLALLRGADVVVYDRLVAGELIALTRPGAMLEYAGKTPGARGITQERINSLLVKHARAGKTVVRLKGGDPFVFGRGGEEAEALARAHIPFEVVPGVTSAFAAPASAGIPVTHRKTAASVAVATAREAEGDSRVDWALLANADTAVVMMGAARLADVVRALIDNGRAPATPAAVIQNATRASQRTVVAPLRRIAAAAARAKIGPPAVLVAGDVVGLREVIGGWDTRPLSGVRVLVTRSREQASELSGILRELGADVVEAPAIRIEPPRSFRSLDAALAQMPEFEWIVFTSANGVRAVVQRLQTSGRDARAFAGVKVCAIGPGTAEVLASIGIVADLVPSTFTNRALASAFPRGDGRVLLARAAEVDDDLESALSKKGWRVRSVTAYGIARAASLDRDLRASIARGEIDIVTFASGGTVRAFLSLLRGTLPRRVKVVCIGPVTAKAARDAGLSVRAVAKQHTIPGLAAAVTEVARRR